MSTYFSQDEISYCDTIDLIQKENVKIATIHLEVDTYHNHRLRFLNNQEITISGVSKPKYNIYLDPRQVSDNPNWEFNTTPFWFQNQIGINFVNLNFTYLIEEYDYIELILDFDEETNKTTEIINYSDGQVLIAYGIVLMEFEGSIVNFKDCIFENNTNRAFEIIAKKESQITFENCIFNGDFNFIFDFDSKIVIKSDK